MTKVEAPPHLWHLFYLIPFKNFIFCATIIQPSIYNKMAVVWERLIRFVATDGRILRGDPILPTPDFDLGTTTADTNLKAKVILGSDPYDTTGLTSLSDEIVTVKSLLGPLAQDDVPILRCVGLNYAKHSMSLSTVPGSLLIPSQSRKPGGLPHHFHSYFSNQSRL